LEPGDLFVRPNVEKSPALDSAASAFASGQTQTKSVQIRRSKVSQDFSNSRVGGHLGRYPQEWESSAAHLFPPVAGKNNGSHGLVGNKVSKNFSIGSGTILTLLHLIDMKQVSLLLITSPSWIAS